MGLFDSWSVKDYKIHLSSTSLRPGQMLSGNLVFTLTSEMSFRSLSLKVVGREFTHIAVRRGSGKNSRTHHYYGKRNFFKVHITPLGMPKWGGRSWQGTLAPGSYNFPFAVLVPHDALPSMCVGAGTMSTATIEYFVKSNMDIPFGPDSDVKVPFVVTTAMAEAQLATAIPYFAPPARMPRTCCCCDSGHTTFTFSIDRNIVILSALVNGGVLNGHITIDNSQSKEHTKEVIVALNQHTTVTAQGHSGIAVTRVASVAIPTNMGKQHLGEQTFSFQLPLVPPPGESLPRAASFKGELIMNTYMLCFGCDGDPLGQLFINGASEVDPSNTALPVQCDTISGRTVPHAGYPRFLYAPPPNSEPLVPHQKGDIGPFSVPAIVADPIPY